MKIDCAHDEIVDINSLKPHPRNTNDHPQVQIDYFQKILDYQGQRKAVVVSNLSKCITKGHGLVIAAKANKWTRVAVDYQDYEDEAQEYADIEADNHLARLAVHNHNLMAQNVLDLNLDTNGFDLDLLGVPDLILELPADVDLDDKLANDKNDELKHTLEVQFSNEKDMVEVYDDLLSRGFIVRCK